MCIIHGVGWLGEGLSCNALLRSEIGLSEPTRCGFIQISVAPEHHVRVRTTDPFVSRISIIWLGGGWRARVGGMGERMDGQGTAEERTTLFIGWCAYKAAEGRSHTPGLRPQGE